MYDIRPMPPELSPALVKRLSSTDTGTIGHFLDAGFMDTGIVARMPGAKIAGRAITVQVTAPDSHIGHYALKFTRPGDVLIVERGADQRVACFGGTSSLGAVRAGVVGLIMDGAGNDISEAAEAGLPIWCRAITPITTKHRNLGGGLNVPVNCGGVVVNPGDAILADENGVVVIPPAMLATVIDEAQAFSTKEQTLRNWLRDPGNITPFPDLTGTSAIIEAMLKEQAEGL